MHKSKSKLVKIVIFTALVCVVSLFAMRFQSNAKLNRLGQSLSVSLARTDEGNSQTGLNAKYLRDKAFAQLWESRKKVAIDDNMIEYLSHPERNVQARAIIALGQLESQKALPLLKSRLERLGEPNEKKTPLSTAYTGVDEEAVKEKLFLQLAIARIETKSLKGKERLTAFAGKFDLTWSELRELSGRCNGDRNQYSRADPRSPGCYIVSDAVDIIYQMGKEGQKVNSIAKQLVLSPPQKFKVELSSLSDRQEAAAIINYGMQLEVTSPQSKNITKKHFLSLGSVSRDELKAGLQALVESKSVYKDTDYGIRFRALLEAAGYSSDESLVPLLKRLGEIYQNDPYVKDDVEKSLKRLQKFHAVPFYPVWYS